MKLLSVFGTRPEAVKMAPLLLRLRDEAELDSLVCVTGQHRELLDQALQFFDIAPDFDLDLMQPAQSLNSLAARTVREVDRVLRQVKPDRVIVHGDTTTALSAAMAAFHRRIPVAHVEAGLRARRMDQPWPEEMNRRAVDMMSDLLFAPTRQARRNLADERISARIFVTGNSAVDALQLVLERLEQDPDLRRRVDAQLPAPRAGGKIVLVTGHRRECIGAPLKGICAALAEIARRPDVDIVWPVHPNPELRPIVEEQLGGQANVHLIPPLELAAFVRMMQRADVIVTDSGGIQEEAPSLGKPVLVTRDVTERPETVAAGAATMVGTRSDVIVREVAKVLDGGRRGSSPAGFSNPFGDGRAARRMVDALLGRPVEEFGASVAAKPEPPVRLAG